MTITLMDVIIKVSLFFAVFYGAIMIMALISKKISTYNDNEKEEHSDKNIEK